MTDKEFNTLSVGDILRSIDNVCCEVVGVKMVDSPWFGRFREVKVKDIKQKGYPLYRYLYSHVVFNNLNRFEVLNENPMRL